jgi:hypothetical protein
MRWLAGNSATGEVVWESNKVVVQPATPYRLEGWLRAAAGEARLGADLLDQDGKVLQKVETPAVKGAAIWRYVAVDLAEAKARAIRVWFRTKGQAGLDDVNLAPAAESFLGNKSVEGADERGRIPFWAKSAMAPFRRAGGQDSSVPMARSSTRARRVCN